MKKICRILSPAAGFVCAAAVLAVGLPRVAAWMALCAAWLAGLTGAFLLRHWGGSAPFGSVPRFLFEWVYDGIAMVPALAAMLALLLLPDRIRMPWTMTVAGALLCALGSMIFPPLLARPLRRLEPILSEEVVGYLVFGVLTTLVNIAAFAVLSGRMRIPELVANVIAWLLSVLFAYVTNRLFVFQSKARSAGALLREAGLFFAARLLSLGIDEGGMALCLYVLHWDKMLAKVLMNVIVVILNYFASKLLIFRKPSGTAPRKEDADL